MEIAHIDHTQLDVELVCSETGHNLGRPWMTLFTDAFSRRILATYVTFDPPSYRSCMMVVRECVRRLARLPQIIVVDHGGEFESVYFETLLARYECTKKTRPPSAVRFGSVCERLFGMANTRFVHNLRGNTQITQCVRQVTPAVDPKNLAVWTLPDLCQHLTEFVYEVYDTLDRPSLGQSPREFYQRGLAATGQRVQRLVPYNREFLMLTLPAPRRGPVRVQMGRGVKANYLYYWCESFRDPEIAGHRVAVRYEPFDAGTAYAFVHQPWVECHSEYYTVFRGRSEKEIKLATEVLRRRYQQHSQSLPVTSRRLAELLESMACEEVLLAQRQKDRELRKIWDDLRLSKPHEAVLQPAENKSVPAEIVSRDSGLQRQCGNARFTENSDATAIGRVGHGPGCHGRCPPIPSAYGGPSATGRGERPTDERDM